MEWSDVLDPDLEPAELILERIPDLHRARIDQFRSFVDTALIFSLHFVDLDERYTLRLDVEDADGEAGEMIDFPQATIRGSRTHWERSIQWASRLVEPADEQIDRYQGRVTLTEDIKQKFERFDGLLKVQVMGFPDGSAPIGFEVVLNDYDDPRGAPTAQLTVQWSVLDDLAHGRLDPVAAARQVQMRGDIGLALDLGGFFMNEFDL